MRSSPPRHELPLLTSGDATTMRSWIRSRDALTTMVVAVCLSGQVSLAGGVLFIDDDAAAGGDGDGVALQMRVRRFIVVSLVRSIVGRHRVESLTSPRVTTAYPLQAKPAPANQTVGFDGFLSGYSFGKTPAQRSG